MTRGDGGPGHWWQAAAVAGYVVLAAAGLMALVASGTDPVALGVLALVATAVLVVLLVRLLGRLPTAVRRLAGDTAVIADASPSQRLDPSGARGLEPLADVVNRLADQRESALRGATEQAEVARRDMESERNRLAALMAQLTAAVIVCNSEGRILLYNEAARSVVGDTVPVGLGRSVFAAVDRGLVAHALERLRSQAGSVYTATTLQHDKLVRVRVTLVRDPDTSSVEAGAGFVLVLEDLTREMRAGDRREHLLRQLTEATRASLGSIRAATESVLEFPELTAAERERFLEIAREEADRLGRRVEDLAREAAEPAEDRVLAEIAGEDLVGVLRHELGDGGTDVAEAAAEPDVWVRADAHAVARALAQVVTRVAEGSTGGVGISLVPLDRHGQLDVRWRGQPPATSAVEGWLDEPIEGAGAATPRDVADRHGAEIWCGDLGHGWAYLRMLLPLAAGAGDAAPAEPEVEVPSRPEFYDFELFTAGPQPADLFDRRLDDLAFTVFDTETTGLDPAGGDRVISIGAVRVVNGRVLRQETFERLVQPGRSVPAASTAIHGITAEMLDGEPPITEVLPAFERFAEDTVLVGHNVSFDLQFLKQAAPTAGVELTQPALDTLLLHAALHPDHTEHTLEAIAGRMGVSVVGRHTALGDALVTADVFVALMALLRRQGIETLSAALAASRRTYQARVDERAFGA
ncbi:MAG TPA: exonuclease domain-containing protein [Nocardioidaceae bacterium]